MSRSGVTTASYKSKSRAEVSEKNTHDEDGEKKAPPHKVAKHRNKTIDKRSQTEKEFLLSSRRKSRTHDPRLATVIPSRKNTRGEEFPQHVDDGERKQVEQQRCGDWHGARSAARDFFEGSGH